MSKPVSASSFWFWTRFIIAMFFVGYALLQANDVIAAQKPSILSVATGDTSELDGTFTKAFDAATYIAYGIGSVTFGIGVVLLSPLLGSRGEKGKTWMVSGATIIVLSGLAQLGLAFFSNLVS